MYFPFVDGKNKNYTNNNKKELEDAFLKRRPLSGNLIQVVGVCSHSFYDISPTKVLGFELEIHNEIQTTQHTLSTIVIKITILI